MDTKLAIVTGGEKGIGLGITLKLLENGYSVVVAGMDEKAARQNLPALSTKQPVYFVKCDVGDENAVKEMVRKANDLPHHRLVGVVGNAGLANPHFPCVEQLDLAEWEKVIRTNLTGNLLLAKHTLSLLKETKGAIVFIASTRGLMAEPNGEPYNASKGGLISLSQSLAISYSNSVRVNCISPGWIETEDYENLKPEDHQLHPAGRVGKPEDIAEMVLYLLSDKAGFISGENFVLDGGVRNRMRYD